MSVNPKRPLVRIRTRVHAILEVAVDGDRTSRLVDIALISLIAANVAAVILETIPELAAAHASDFHLFETVSVAVFATEYVLRVWSAPTDPRFAHPVWGRLRFMFSPMALVDLFAILPFFLPFVMDVDLRVLRALRLLRIFRMLKVARYSESMLGMGIVLRRKKEELTVALAFSSVLLLMASSVLYFVEREAQPDAFVSIPAAMWWAIATLTTVGYGDIYPITALGRLCGAVVAVLGVGMFALPAGILASGFSEYLEDKKKNRCPHCGKEL